MAWDGNGTFSRTNGGGQTGASTWQNAQAAGHNIVSNQHDTHDQDIATGLNAALTKNNETKPTVDFRPNADAAIDLGSAALQWRDLFLSRDLVFGGNMDAKKGADIASATTTDLGATRGLMHDITGTTPITSFGTGAEGMFKIIKFEGALTLTHNATSLILPGAVNITTVDGDTALMFSEGSGNWRCIAYAGKNVNAATGKFSGTLDVSGASTLTGGATIGTGGLSLGFKQAYTTANVALTSQTTLQTQTDLTVAIGASETWLLEYTLYFTASIQTTGLKFAVNTPASAVQDIFSQVILNFLDLASGIYSPTFPQVSMSTTSGNVFTITAAAVAYGDSAIVTISVRVTASGAGDVTLQYAQETSSGTALNLLRGSRVIARRVS